VHLVAKKIELLADLFLGAAYSDKSLCDEERAYIRKLLADLLCVEKIPRYLDRRIESYNNETFSLQAAAQEFASEPPMSKRRLLELVAHVIHADNILDFAEDDYLRELAELLEVSPDEYKDLVLDYEIEQLRESFTHIASSRPPAPNRG
jgi:uncharacterized tellurite resistance protein B-like protein